MRREARLERDVDAVALTVYRRALRNEDTSVSDIMPTLLISCRYGDGARVTTDAVTHDGMREIESYGKTLLRRVADEHPAMSGRIEI